MTQSLVLVVTTEAEDTSVLNGWLESSPEKFEALDVKRLEGGELVTLVVTLSVFTLRSVASLLTELIRARKHISIRCEGVEILGVSEKGAERILRELLEERLSITIESTKVELFEGRESKESSGE